MSSDNGYLKNRSWKITFFLIWVFLGQNLSVLISDIEMQKLNKKNQLAMFCIEK